MSMKDIWVIERSRDESGAMTARAPSSEVVRFNLADDSFVTIQLHESATSEGVCDLIRKKRGVKLIHGDDMIVSISGNTADGRIEEWQLSPSDYILDRLHEVANSGHTNVRAWCWDLNDKPARICLVPRQGYVELQSRRGIFRLRWVVVHDERLFVFSDHLARKARFCLDLWAASVRPCPPSAGKDLGLFEFEIVEHSRLLRLRCADHAQQTEWINSIEQHCHRRVRLNQEFHRAEAAITTALIGAERRDAMITHLVTVQGLLSDPVAVRLLAEYANAKSPIWNQRLDFFMEILVPTMPRDGVESMARSLLQADSYVKGALSAALHHPVSDSIVASEVAELLQQPTGSLVNDVQNVISLFVSRDLLIDFKSTPMFRRFIFSKPLLDPPPISDSVNSNAIRARSMSLSNIIAAECPPELAFDPERVQLTEDDIEDNAQLFNVMTTSEILRQIDPASDDDEPVPTRQRLASKSV